MCPGHLKMEAENIRQSTVTMAHELAHALGFMRDAFRYTRDKNNEPRTNRDPQTDEPNEIDANQYSIPGPRVLSTVTRVWRSYRHATYREVTVLITPIMVEKAREYFNCQQLDGVELESEESEGNRQHIERRILENEIMTALYTQRSYVSPILLGYFEDTGWYIPDYTKANKITYGKNLGCNFIMRSCYEYMQIQKAKGESFYPYCDYHDFYKTLCLKNQNAYGYCDLTTFTDDLDAEFRYFENPRLAPSKNYLLHGYGEDAICIDHDKSKQWEIHEQGRTKVQDSPQSTCLKKCPRE
ncbi:unnamed protein product [Trichobilharzia szidati]|nr:unnamed protein product [Trichobilharzia szidati]